MMDAVCRSAGALSTEALSGHMWEAEGSGDQRVGVQHWQYPDVKPLRAPCCIDNTGHSVGEGAIDQVLFLETLYSR